MPKITVVTPSIRREGLALTRATLAAQTFRDFEWLIGSPFNPEMQEAEWVEDDFTGGFWTLNRINTKLCKTARGELIVFLQDYIWVMPDGLQKFWDRYKETGGAIAGIGDKYDRVDIGGGHGKITHPDIRREHLHAPFVKEDDAASSLEMNWSCCPKSALEAVNYFVDEADFLGFSCDNVMVADRMHRLVGLEVYTDSTNECWGYEHERVSREWEEHHLKYTDYFKNKEYLRRDPPVPTD
jgi:hypothetical protein